MSWAFKSSSVTIRSKSSPDIPSMSSSKSPSSISFSFSRALVHSSSFSLFVDFCPSLPLEPISWLLGGASSWHTGVKLSFASFLPLFWCSCSLARSSAIIASCWSFWSNLDLAVMASCLATLFC
ncbi:hypothetical protein RND81_08G082000 [Saponaria officinalis]|uniref:Uncharacterized protein n=1 Tax=Saponaria officinalis TaxID=3572 RepID=A0AAW1J796_SAPOF